MYVPIKLKNNENKRREKKIYIQGCQKKERHFKYICKVANN